MDKQNNTIEGLISILFGSIFFLINFSQKSEMGGIFYLFPSVSLWMVAVGVYFLIALPSIFIVDSLFNADEAHMIRILETLARLSLPIRFSCYLQPKMSEPGIFRLLKKAGCVFVDFGTDSGSPAMLASLRKPFTTDNILQVSLSCREAGIDFCHSLIFGGPGETRESIIETVRIMDETVPRAVIAMTGVRIYPDTEMHRAAVKEGLCETGQSLLDPQFYFSQMGPKKLLENAYEAAEGRKNWFFPGRKD